MNVTLISGTVENGPRNGFLSPLANALSQLEHDVTTVAPLSLGTDLASSGLARRLTPLTAQLGDAESIPCVLFEGRSPRGVRELFVDPETKEDATRSEAFAMAAFQLLEQSPPEAGVIHAIDWEGALALHLASERNVGGARLLTITRPTQLGATPAENETPALPLGIRAAHWAVFESPSALEIAIHDEDSPLRSFISPKLDRVRAVESGVDSTRWNPATDPAIASRYDPFDLSGKRSCRAELLRALRIDADDNALVIGCPTENTDAQSTKLLEVARSYSENNSWVIITVGDKPESESLPNITPNDTARLHQLLAGADVWLARSEQKDPHVTLALEYGTLPIAPRTPALLDVITDLEPSLQSGTGFLYDAPTEPVLRATLDRVLEAFQDTSKIDAVRSRAMLVDRSWEKAARVYDALYRALP